MNTPDADLREDLLSQIYAALAAADPVGDYEGAFYGPKDPVTGRERIAAGLTMTEALGWVVNGAPAEFDWDRVDSFAAESCVAGAGLTDEQREILQGVLGDEEYDYWAAGKCGPDDLARLGRMGRALTVASLGGAK